MIRTFYEPHRLRRSLSVGTQKLAKLFIISLLAALPAVADEPQQVASAEVDFFETRIRPVLVTHCYECHSDKLQESDLRLDSRPSVRRGGERGPAVVPGDPNSSVLFSVISHEDETLRMPPKGPRLPQPIIDDFRRWILAGASDPRDSAESNAQSSQRLNTAAHWAYQRPQLAELPATFEKSWLRQPIDHFVLASLEQNGLSPTRDAQPGRLLRRLHFDLIGLPPTVESVNHFLVELEQWGFEIAWASEVDRLLASPAFGERWGRHWLDVARFGESSGGESNVSFPYAWRFRDYVINAFNADIPYDQFVTEQLAGDLLPNGDQAERARLLVATGYLAIGTKNLGENNDKQFQADLVDEQIDSLTRGLLGSSVACARCHDHKFDPFTMEDYYGMAGIFASTRTFFGTFTSPANNRGGEPLRLPSSVGLSIFHKSLPPDRFKELKKSWAELSAERAEIEKAHTARFAGGNPEKSFTLQEVLANRWRLGAVEGKLATVDDHGKAIPLAMGVLDANEIVDAPLLARGDIKREGANVPRAFPKVFHGSQTKAVPRNRSGRLELAQWLTDPEHPLTSRVFVNRVWRHMFGRGLVATCDDFGITGAVPSHPELLDTLAVQFMRDGWSTKALVRSLAVSRTYRQESEFDEEAFQIDPENALLWRMPKRRLEAEAIRDAMLFVSNDLKFSNPGGSLVATRIGDRPISLIGLDKRLPADLDGALHRSVYLPVIRDRLPDVLDLFDFAEPSLVTGDRANTNVPVQALYLMNSSFVFERARSLATRLKRECRGTQELVTRAFEICYARQPTVSEQLRSMEFVGDENESERTSNKKELELDDKLISFCQALLSTAEFRNLD